MGLEKEIVEINQVVDTTGVTIAKKRRLRRKKLKAARALTHKNNTETVCIAHQKPTSNELRHVVPISDSCLSTKRKSRNILDAKAIDHFLDCVKQNIDMSSKGDNDKSRDNVLAAREAKKLVKQKKKKGTDDITSVPQQTKVSSLPSSEPSTSEGKIQNIKKTPEPESKASSCNKNEVLDTVITNKDKNVIKSKDEVDKAQNTNIIAINPEISKDSIKGERSAKKAAQQAKKNTASKCSDALLSQSEETKPKDDIPKIENLDTPPVHNAEVLKVNPAEVSEDISVNDIITVKDVVNTLKDIVNVAKDVQSVTDKVKAINLGPKKDEESTKSKAELKAERRAKQDAQRAAKQAAQQQKTVEIKTEPNKKSAKPKEEKVLKPKTADKVKPKSQVMQKMNWFQHLYTEHDKEAIKQMAMNSNLHPAVIKLGIQLATHVVTGSNARCIALLDALKKMVKDYSLPARTEFARGLESQLAASVDFLWSMRPPAASQTNALKYFRHRLTQLPNNVDEFDAKKRLQEEIDQYIHDQIDKAGEAISNAVRKKISDGDNILTYGCSSLIERILCEAHEAGVKFRAVVVGVRVQRGGREMLRRLVSRGVVCTYADISALNFLMRDMSKVLIGAASLLANGAVLAPAGSLQTALVARAHNVPLLVAQETHKFSDAVQTDAFVYNEIGDPDDLIDKSDENSPLKNWRSNPNLTLLNLKYDVTPPSLVTAVVTDLGILPCTSAPVVLRFKLTEYGL